MVSTPGLILLILCLLYVKRGRRLCNNYQEGELGGWAEKLELSSKNLDSTPPPKQKKLILTPLCYVKNNVAPPLPQTKKSLHYIFYPWEKSLLNFVMRQIYMEFSKSIQSMKKHYFYTHQKPTKLVFEICLIPIVLWGKLKNKFMTFALHRISSIN